MSICAVLISLFCSLGIRNANAQGVTSDGKDFYLGYVAPSYNKVAHPATLGFYGAYILLSSYADNVITISYFDDATGLEDVGSSYPLKARQGISVPLNLTKMFIDGAGKVQYRTCHITAKKPIHAEFFSTGACAGGSFLVLPTVGLGKKYVVSSWHDNIDGTNGIFGGFYGASALEVAGGFFQITAAFDSTMVTIKERPLPPDTDPYISVVQLNRGQCYLVKSRRALNSDDISGSIIESTKPVAVIAGHENAALGGLYGFVMEGRNMMVQQMTPVEYWDNKDIISLPFKESAPLDTTHSGAGDLFRVVVYDSSGANIHANYTPAGEVQFSAAAFGASDLDNVWNPVNFHSDGGMKFSVTQIDKADQNTSAPFPRPAMMMLVPKSKWRTSFVWYVPNNRFETLQGYYVNIIAPQGDFDTIIKSSFNGGPIKPIKQVLNLEQTFQIPGHPELLGVRFKLYPGSYYATSSHPFIVYNYGFRGLDPDFDLGDFDEDDFFFSYASPAGMLLSGSDSANMSVTVDTSCSSWKICATDYSGRGIKGLVLLDDAAGDIIRHPPPNPPYGYQYNNTKFDDALDPTNSHEIVYSGKDTAVCFEVYVQNIFKNGYAPVLIVDDAGRSKIVELNFAPVAVDLRPDSAEFMNLKLGTDSCAKSVFKNISPKGGKSITMLSADLSVGKYFWISGTVPQLPASIKAGDSLIVTACFAPKDTNAHLDTLVFRTDCGPSQVSLIGSGAIPIIVADDHNFGTVLKDSTKCDTVRVRNIGKAPLLLTKDWLLHNSVNFSFPDSTQLPLWLAPGKSALLTICYTPHSVQIDTAILNWGTNEKDPYAHSNKDTSILRGAGIKSGVRWDRATQDFYADSTKETVVRMYLFNNLSASVLVTNVFIEGKDSTEFRIVDNQLGYPLKNIQMDPGDSIWVDVGFMPDMTKPIPERYAARSADLVAASKNDTEQVVQMIASFSFAKVKETSSVKHVVIRPNPSSGAYTSVLIELEKPEHIAVALFDVLGREVRDFGSRNFGEGISEFTIPTSSFSPGMYYLRIQDESGIITRKLEITQ